jgi:hypothetical protein
MNTFGWSGSLVPYYQQYIAPLQSLLSHPQKGIRDFAKRALAAINSSIRDETKRDEERQFGIY